MNWFVFISGGLYVGGMIVEIYKQNWAMATVYFGYSVAAFALAVGK